MWIATAAEMRETEALASSEHGIAAETLMENAGRAVFDAVRRAAPGPSPVAVVCGPGNNGGDGYVVARLAHEAGFDVSVFATTLDLKGLPLEQEQRCRAAGCKVSDLSDPSARGALKRGHWPVVVDAVLGTGATREVSGTVAAAIEAINAMQCHRIAVDVPSGIETDSGEVLGMAVMAHETVTLGLPKPYLFLRSGPGFSGKWSVADIGFPQGLLERPTGVRLAPTTTVLPVRTTDSHKGANGHVVVIAGSARYRGAATLAAQGALKAGAGLVTVAAIEPVIAAVASHVPEAVFLPLPEDEGAISEKAAPILIEAQKAWESAVIGPGLGLSPGAGRFLRALWSRWEVRSVLDADALNWLARAIEPPVAFCILTPHPGEAGRLLGEPATAATVQSDRFGAVRRLCETLRRPVLLKGAYSVYATHGGPLTVNSTGNAGMASGGTGDVLAGVIGTLLAQLPPGFWTEAGWKGALWHGLAGDLCAQEIGKIGFSASDIAQFLPRARSILTT
ncbi:MAG: NAD(P)H-hydrate dehydratase [Armatimonadetes bacterium]|nr:NAD(P)H-hydrate dehydratase [Armatimonadota bacterium]